MNKKQEFKTSIGKRYLSGENLKQIAISEDCVESTVWKYLKEMGVPRRKKGFQKGHSISKKIKKGKRKGSNKKVWFKSGKSNPSWKGGVSLRKDYRKKRYEKLKKDYKFCLNYKISRSICKALKGKKAGRKWEKLVGYTLQDLIERLESLFDENMNWENQGSYWHIDHIKPKSLFNYDSPKDKEFKECWALSNLQPLEAKANIKKYNHYEN